MPRVGVDRGRKFSRLLSAEQFYTESNGYKIAWSLKDVPEALKRPSSLWIPTYTSSQVVFSDFSPKQFTFKCFDAMRVDMIASKNQTYAARASGAATTAVTIISGFTGRKFASFEAYVTEGARSAFNFGWQYGPFAEKSSLPWAPSDEPWALNQPALEELKARSVPADTNPEKLMELLGAKGLTTAECKALWDWLGADVRLTLAR